MHRLRNCNMMNIPHTGYFDLQINGFAGIDFNQQNLAPVDLVMACDALASTGVTGILVTIITDSVPAMADKLQQIATMCETDETLNQMIKGFHIEGPFLSRENGYIGAHPVEHACEASLDKMKILLDAAAGKTRLVTLAPEQDPKGKVINYLAQQNIVVSAGHTNATLDELKHAIDHGLGMFTHLGNGCPRLMDRHDNIIQRVLSLASYLWISFIADGAHIPLFVLENYLSFCDLNRVVIVTDAIAAAGCPPGKYQLGDQWVTVGEDGVPRAADDSHLVGSGATMIQMIEKLKRLKTLSATDIELITRLNPWRILSDITNIGPKEPTGTN